MLKKHDLGITPYTENIGSRDRSLVRMGTSRVYVDTVPTLYVAVQCKNAQIYVMEKLFYSNFSSA